MMSSFNHAELALGANVGSQNRPRTHLVRPIRPTR